MPRDKQVLPEQLDRLVSKALLVPLELRVLREPLVQAVHKEPQVPQDRLELLGLPVPRVPLASQVIKASPEPQEPLEQPAKQG